MRDGNSHNPKEEDFLMPSTIIRKATSIFSIPGVTLKLEIGGKTLWPNEEKDGFIGKLGYLKPTEATLLVDLPQAKQSRILHGAMVNDETHGVSLLSGRHIETRIPIYYQTKHGFNYTLASSNNVRVLEFNFGESPVVITWEISLIIQGGKFFVVCQPTFSENLYANEGEVLCPGFDRWPQMVQEINIALRDQNITLPPLPEKKCGEILSRTSVGENKGEVKFFAIRKGIGVLYVPNGEALFHYSDIKTTSRLAHLAPGQKVTYESLIKTKKKGYFSLQAKGISPLN